MSAMGLHENNNITVKYHSVIKKIFDDIDEVILKYNEPDAVENNYFNATQDQRENSNVSLVVAPNTDDGVALCRADGSVKIEKDENENSYCVTDLPCQETTINYFSDDESSPKKSKQFTFTESNLPDSEEIKEFLKAYPRPKVTEPLCDESEAESNSEDECNWCSRRRRKKTKHVTEVTIDKLPTRFITRKRVPNRYLVCTKDCLRLLQSIYLKRQEVQMDEDIIRENINRLKMHSKSKGILDLRIVKPERKETKSKSFAQKNIKKSTLDSIPTAKSTTMRTRCLKNKTDGKNIKRTKPRNKYKKQKKNINIRTEKPVRKDTKSTPSHPLAQKDNKKCTVNSISAAETNDRRTRAMKNLTNTRNTKSKNVSSGNTKNDYKQKPADKKQRSTLPVLPERRSKRYQKIKEKHADMMKAPVSIPKKSMHEQSTVYNISSSSSESPKSLKRSLVEDSDEPSPKRTRSQNNNVTNASTQVRVIMKTRRQDERIRKRVKSLQRLNSNTKFLNSKTRSTSALRRRTRGTIRASTKRL